MIGGPWSDQEGRRTNCIGEQFGDSEKEEWSFSAMSGPKGSEPVH